MRLHGGITEDRHRCHNVLLTASGPGARLIVDDDVGLIVLKRVCLAVVVYW